MKRVSDAVERDGDGHGVCPYEGYDFYEGRMAQPWCALPSGNGYFDASAFEYDEPREYNA